MRIFVTGATGCVGSYLVRAVLERTGHEVILNVRNAARLPPEVRANPRVTVVESDLRALGTLAPSLAGVDAAILVATSWGGADATAVIRDANLALADALIAQGCRHILYFATASVLAADGAALPEAASFGTDYIRAKAELMAGMEARAAQARITGLFPTLVLGGEPGNPAAPLSHFARLLGQVTGWIGLIRLLSAEGRLHIIHAADIATVTLHLCETFDGPASGADRIVLGNPAMTVDAMIDLACKHFGRRRRPIVRLRLPLAEALIRLFRIQLSPWDRYCMLHPDQSYRAAVNPASFGLPVAMPDLSAGIARLEVPARPG